jgi:hypothetical protein
VTSIVGEEKKELNEHYNDSDDENGSGGSSMLL